MGIIPDDITYGLNCTRCFDPGETPKYFKAFFAGIQRGNLWTAAMGPPPNGYYDLEQNPDFPCHWNDTIEGWPSVGFRLLDGQSQLFLKPSGIHTAFTKNYNSNCIFGFENFYQGAAGNKFFGGWGHVTPAYSLGAIVEQISPMIDPNPRLENFPTADDETVVRYAGTRDGTNIKILFDMPYPM